MIITIYNIDSDRFFTGLTQEIEITKPIPKDYTPVTPPDVPQGKYAFFSGRMWTIVDERPTQPEPTPAVTPVVTRVSKFEFRSRFTMEEKVAIYTAAETDVVIRVFLDDIMTAEFIDLTLPDVINSVQYLEQKSIIGVGRAIEVTGNVGGPDVVEEVI